LSPEIAQQRRATHDHPGRAESALDGIMCDERRLNGMQAVACGQAFDRRHPTLANVDRQHHA
jgi:hypothetical protein